MSTPPFLAIFRGSPKFFGNTEGCVRTTPEMLGVDDQIGSEEVTEETWPWFCPLAAKQ